MLFASWIHVESLSVEILFRGQKQAAICWPDPSAESQGGKWFLEPPGVLREILGFKSLKKFILKVCLRSGNRTLAFSASLHFCRHGGGPAR